MSPPFGEQPIQEPVRRTGPGGYNHLLQRLNVKSIEKHYDAFTDIDWDGADFRIDPDDPRWVGSTNEPLAGTDWFRALHPSLQSRIALHIVVEKMQVGVLFENVLKRGLLEFAASLPNDALELRYAYHEVIEEAQHALMFAEFIRRSGIKTGAWRTIKSNATRRVVPLGSRFPALFFLFVLGGEAPIDWEQRRALRCDNELPPILRRIMQIHVTEEARHLAFAKAYLRKTVPRLSMARRMRLSLAVPNILGTMSRLMLEPAPGVVEAYRIPHAVLQQAYKNNPAHKATLHASLRDVFLLCRDLDIITPRNVLLWKAWGLDPYAI